jgi:hypothetical protein
MHFISNSMEVNMDDIESIEQVMDDVGIQLLPALSCYWNELVSFAMCHYSPCGRDLIGNDS